MSEKEKEKPNIYLEHLDEVYGPGPVDITAGMGRAASVIKEINRARSKVVPISPKDTPEEVNRADQLGTPTGQTGQTTRADRADQLGTQGRPLGQTGHTNWADQLNTPTGHTDWADHPTLDRVTFDSRVGLFKSKNYRRIALHFLRIGKRQFFTAYNDLADELGIPFATVRKAFDALKDQGIIKSEYHYNRDRRQQGQMVTFLGPVREGEEEGADQLGTPKGQTTSPSKIDRENINLSIKDKLLSISDDEMGMVFPNLYRTGFTCSSLHQAVDKRDKFGFSLDLVMKFLRFAESELEHGIMLDKDGSQVRSPSDYLFRTLSSGKAYRRPRGYVDPEEEALAEEEQRRKELARKKEQLENEAFEEWEKSLSEVRRRELDEERLKSPHPMPMAVFLKQVWRAHHHT